MHARHDTYMNMETPRPAQVRTKSMRPLMKLSSAKPSSRMKAKRLQRPHRHRHHHVTRHRTMQKRSAMNKGMRKPAKRTKTHQTSEEMTARANKALPLRVETQSSPERLRVSHVSRIVSELVTLSISRM